MEVYVNLNFWKKFRIGSNLRPITQLAIVSPGCDPTLYFVNRTGLFVYRQCLDDFVGIAGRTAAGKRFELAALELTQPAYDAEIEQELAENYLMETADVCAIMAAIIENDLRSPMFVRRRTSHSELFYTPDFVVHLLRYEVDRNNFVGVWKREAQNQWGAGTRIYCPVVD
jgi:hypothetical protein